MDTSVWTVLGAALITAIATGLGALPFLFVKEISERTLGMANAAAAGLMLGASIGLLVEGIGVSLPRSVLGALLGFILIIVAQHFLEEREDELHIGKLQEADALKMLLIVGIMTVHSFAEGVGVGVAFGEGAAFGGFISLAIAVHNIPEGIAISLVLVPRGVAVWRAAGWSIFSSLPQPLVAVPAFLFVLLFKPFLPVGLGLAAGAMIYMVFSELLPESREHVSLRTATVVTSLAIVCMLAFQAVIG